MEGRTREDTLGQGGLGKWEDLNRDCLANIFERAGMESLIMSLSLVCKNWYAASLDPHCWKVLDFSSVVGSKFRKKFFSDATQFYHHFEATMCLHKFPLLELVNFAVDRSQGIATKVVLPNIQRDFEDVITYISNCCPMLKTLVLPELILGDVEGERGEGKMGCITKLINKWKHMEHLSIICEENFHEIISEISIHCNNFASLTTGRRITEEAATTIVTLLPNIKSLKLSGSILDRKNLVWILSQCKKLEFLDVSCCEGFDADDAEILKMASHIGTFLPEGSVYFEDYDLLCDYYDD